MSDGKFPPPGTVVRWLVSCLWSLVNTYVSCRTAFNRKSLGKTVSGACFESAYAKCPPKVSSHGGTTVLHKCCVYLLDCGFVSCKFCVMQSKIVGIMKISLICGFCGKNNMSCKLVNIYCVLSYKRNGGYCASKRAPGTPPGSTGSGPVTGTGAPVHSHVIIEAFQFEKPVPVEKIIAHHVDGIMLTGLHVEQNCETTLREGSLDHAGNVTAVLENCMPHMDKGSDSKGTVCVPTNNAIKGICQGGLITIQQHVECHHTGEIILHAGKVCEVTTVTKTVQIELKDEASRNHTNMTHSGCNLHGTQVVVKLHPNKDVKDSMSLEVVTTVGTTFLFLMRDLVDNFDTVKV